MDECHPPSRMAIIRARGSTVARQCASHCRCRLPALATEQSRLPAAHPRSCAPGVSGRAQCTRPPHALDYSREAPWRAPGALPAMRLQQLGRECVAEVGGAALARRAAAQQSEPAPGGGRVYRALHSPSGGCSPRIALRFCALLFPFPFFLLGRLEAARGVGFRLQKGTD